MLGLAHDIGAVVNAVEIDRLAVVVLPCAVRRRGETDHRCQRCPAVNVRHHFAIARAGRNLAGCPHDAGHAETALERRAFFAAERNTAGVRPRILPRAVVGGDDDDGVWEPPPGWHP